MTDTLINTVQTRVDTLSVIDAAKVTEFYSSMMDKQSAQFSILISVLCGIVVIIIGATWWWNFIGSKAQISKEINEGLAEIQKTLEEQIKSKIDKRMSDTTANVKKELEAVKETLTKENLDSKAEVCRVFALHCFSEHLFFNSACWWLSAFEDYHAMNNGEFEQIAVNAYVKALESSYEQEILIEGQVEKIEDLVKRTEMIPDVFTQQKREAKKNIKKIDEKAKKKE